MLDFPCPRKKKSKFGDNEIIKGEQGPWARGQVANEIRGPGWTILRR